MNHEVDLTIAQQAQHPEQFLRRKLPGTFSRPSCHEQFFSEPEVAENFARKMEEIGLIADIVPHCQLCGHIHVRVLRPAKC